MRQSKYQFIIQVTKWNTLLTRIFAQLPIAKTLFFPDQYVPNRLEGQCGCTKKDSQSWVMFLRQQTGKTHIKTERIIPILLRCPTEHDPVDGTGRSGIFSTTNHY